VIELEEENNSNSDLDKVLGIEIDKAKKTIMLSTKSTIELIKEAVTDSNVSNFFRLLNNNADYMKFLFLHRFDLFGFGKDINLPHLHLCDMPKGQKTDEESKTLKQLIVTNESYFEFDLDGLLQKFFGLDDQGWKYFVEKYRDITTYLNVLAFRKIPEFKQLVEMEEFNYPFMKSIVGDYQRIDEKLEIEEQEIDTVILEMIRSLFAQFVRSAMSNIEGILTKSKEIGSFLYVPSHLSARIWIDNLLNLTDLEFTSYINLLDDLYRNNLIDARSILSWCENCSLENQLLTQTIGRIAPSKISRDKCLNCQKIKSYAAIFAFTDLFREIMLCNDGILAVFFGWLLEVNKIEYVFGKYSSNREIDFIINNSILVEIKTLRVQRDTVTLFSNFENALNQLRKQISDLKEEGIKIKKCYLLWNQWIEFNLNKISVPAKYKDLIKKYNIEIIDPLKIEKIID